MINIGLKEIHLGEAIRKRVEEIGITKTEFGRRIGVPQQHVNRIFERDTMETKRLIKVCRALEFNFFALFCELSPKVEAHMSAVSLGPGNANNNIGDAAVATQIEVLNTRIAGMEAMHSLVKEQVELLKSQLRDKDEIITLLKTSKS